MYLVIAPAHLLKICSFSMAGSCIEPICGTTLTRIPVVSAKCLSTYIFFGNPVNDSVHKVGGLLGGPACAPILVNEKSTMVVYLSPANPVGPISPANPVGPVGPVPIGPVIPCGPVYPVGPVME